MTPRNDSRAGRGVRSSTILPLLVVAAVGFSASAFVGTPRRGRPAFRASLLQNPTDPEPFFADPEAEASAPSPPTGKERDLRSIIEERNSALPAGTDEGSFGLNEDTPDAAAAAAAALVDSSDRMIARATKVRPYPLFVLEKAAEFVDEVAAGVGRAVSATGVEFGEGAGRSSATTQTVEKVVVLGTGWGAASFLKDADTDAFDVTVVSPRNFFLFTPMLAGSSVGTVEYRSITEPIRLINGKARYLEATATSIDREARTVTCESVVCEGNSCTIEEFVVEYDRLIFSVGAQTNTFGIPGVREYCNFLKGVDDARRIRTAIINCFERAGLPHLTDDQRRATLTFAVIGAGPTGVEFASELRDFVEQEGPRYYPQLLQFIKIKIIEASPTVLAPFDRNLQAAAIDALTRRSIVGDEAQSLDLTELLLDSGVSEVSTDAIRLADGREIPYGLAVWAAGNGPLPITLQLIEELGAGAQSEAQSVARGRLAVDPWLRVLGGDGSIFSLGDCSCAVANQLPATAQVAGQQGSYLARLLARCRLPEDGAPPARRPDAPVSVADAVTGFTTGTNTVAAPFQFLNLGILAYTGDGSALAQLQLTPSEGARVKGTGKIGFGLWRSVYLSKQVSVRNRVLVLFDWAKTRVFGRDITRI